MIFEAIVLLTCQIAGYWLVTVSGIPLPGPVMGMMLLFCYLLIRRGPPLPMERITSPLLSHMSLLFIPAGSGVLLYMDRIASEWLPITAAILGSTFLTLVITAWVMDRSLSMNREHGDTSPNDQDTGAMP